LSEIALTAPQTPSLLNITRRRPRPTSMLIQNTTTKATSREKNQRRSSFVDFSSRLFDRKPWTSNNDENSKISSDSKKHSRSSQNSNRSNDSIPDVWVTTGGPLTPSAPNGRPDLYQAIDPSNYSEAKSMFVDLSSDSSPTGTPKGESFLSLTYSSNNSSQSFTRLERPTSIHTMPLPSRSRRSSFHYRPPPAPAVTYAEKSDFFLILEEEPSLATEPIFEDQEWDAPAKIDWRQFHIDILTTDDTQ
jgi:hypothetical protein